ncbi:UvrD-helicase domain-containing protein [Chroococcus sp. FPU101]|uniref:UvrD-helicase domain-containing protein n=1 Tax=Chroococcus sp. FPU101 TaxID=1974212 RepID=UPI001A8BF4AE|nr:UvrD-helicase domain-containing protein [Chroococcus sp. FPU101]GFE69046.1 hypothetical protein CFPU101_16560 [Chroococcus sp. FPU101]
MNYSNLTQEPLEKMTPQHWRKEVKTFPWNEYQRYILEWVGSSNRHGSIEAVAGSGKTTLIEGTVATLPSKSRIKIIAFNVHIVERLKTKGRIPISRVSVSTSHSLAFSLLMAMMRGQAKLDENKPNSILKQTISKYQSHPEKYSFEDTPLGKLELKLFRNLIKKIASFCQKTLTDPENTEECQKLCSHYNLNYQFPTQKYDFIQQTLIEQRITQWAIRCVTYYLKVSEKIASETGQLSFDDLHWLCHKWQLIPPKYDYCLVDEAQDLNASQIALIKSLANQGARLLLFGDRFQAIMGFQGSDSNSWTKIREEFNTENLPLSICHRCNHSIIKLARNLVPYLQGDPLKEQGCVKYIAHQGVLDQIQDGDLILSRFNAPLIRWCLAALQKNLSAKIRGRNIGKYLIEIAKQYLMDKLDWPTQWLDNLNSHYQKLIETANKNEDSLLAAQYEDEQKCLLYCYSEFKSPNFDTFCQQLLNLFDDENRPSLLLSTIHRAKGDEARRVFILNPEALPYFNKNKKTWEDEQEINLLYVAMTRAMNELYLVNTPRNANPKEPGEIKELDKSIEEVFTLDLTEHSSKIRKQLIDEIVLQYEQGIKEAQDDKEKEQIQQLYLIKCSLLKTQIP